MTPNQTRQLILDLQAVSRAERSAQESLIVSLEAQVLARVLPLYERARKEAHDPVFGDLPALGNKKGDLEWVCYRARELCDAWQIDGGDTRAEIAKLRETIAAIDGVA